MFVGHLGVGLAAKALEPRMKLGTLFFAALLADIVFWLLVLAGVERITVPAGDAIPHLFGFHFPYSHSLLGTFVLAVAFAVAWAKWGARRARRLGIYWDGIALLVATVLSHWVLDIVVHVSDMPILPAGVGLGFGLWRFEPSALFVELVIVAAAFTAFILRTGLSVVRKLAVGVTMTGLGAVTALGVYGHPPQASALALASLIAMGFAILVAAWADRSR